MLLGIVSDTHGRVENARAAVYMLESLGVDEVIHCGDVGSSDVIRCFQRWPFHYVLGNVDGDGRDLVEGELHGNATCHGRFGELEREAKRIAFLHGDDGRRLQETVASGHYDLVCRGHTHVAEQRQVGPTLLLNPGALFRAAQHSLAVVELPAVAATIVHV
jgi:hypothetical protein